MESNPTVLAFSSQVFVRFAIRASYGDMHPSCISMVKRDGLLMCSTSAKPIPIIVSAFRGFDRVSRCRAAWGSVFLRQAHPWLLLMVSCLGPLLAVSTALAQRETPSIAASGSETSSTPSDRAPTPDEGLDVEGFLYLDESGVPVLRPDMTLEMYERLKRLQEGLESKSEIHLPVALNLTGTVQTGRANFKVDLSMNVESTDGRWVATPLRMGNFHPTDEFELTTSPWLGDAQPDRSDSSEETNSDSNQTDRSESGQHRIVLSPENDGFVLWSKTEQPCRLRIQVPVSVRISDDRFTQSIQFNLPDVSSAISISIPATRLETELLGSGDEVVSTREGKGGTNLSIESLGGEFTLRWSRQSGRPATESLLDVQTLGRMTWDGPQDQPILSTQMTVQNLRGDVTSFDIELPEDAILLSTPSVPSATSGVDIRVAGDGEGRLIQVRFSDESRLSSVDLLVDLQLRNRAASAENPLVIRLPRVLDATRQNGRLTIASSENYRLRWLDPLFVQSVANENENQASARRVQTFEFDRGDAQLPVWLATKKRQLRLTNDLELSLSDSTVSAVMTIRPSGQVVDGRGLKVDLADWRILAIQELETGNSLEPFGEGSIREIELVQGQRTELVSFQIVAEQVIPDGESEIDVRLPHVIEGDRSILVSQTTLKIARGGKRSLIVDTSRSIGLERIQENGGFATPTVASVFQETSLTGLAPWSRYRVLPSENAPRMIATLIDQPQSITLLSDVKVELDGDRIKTTIDWPINSQFDLEGRLPIRILGMDPNIPVPSGDWTVSVDGVPAYLQRIPEPNSNSDPSTSAADLISVRNNGVPSPRYEIISDRLTSGGRSVRWQFSQPRLRTDTVSDALETIPLPRPDTSQMLLRGSMRVVLLGDAQGDLVAVDQEGQTQLSFDSLPRQPLRVQWRPKAQILDDSVVRRAVIRTSVGRDVRHERILARVSGGRAISFFLPDSTQSLSATATVDGQSTDLLRRGNLLELELGEPTRVHTVELNVWFPVSRSAWIEQIQPMIRVAAGVEQVYWQLVTPRSQHLIWASPTIGRAMSWRFDGWRMIRRPTENSAALAQWVGSEDTQNTQVGNEYLYLGTSAPAFAATVIDRSLLWLLVGSVVLISAAVLTYVPSTRHPLTAIFATVLLGGLLIIAPDAAVLMGQWMLVGMVLVAVTTALRVLMSNRRGSRVLSKRQRSKIGEKASTYASPGSQSIDPAASSERRTKSKAAIEQSRLVEPIGSEKGTNSGRRSGDPIDDVAPTITAAPVALDQVTHSRAPETSGSSLTETTSAINDPEDLEPK